MNIIKEFFHYLEGDRLQDIRVNDLSIENLRNFYDQVGRISAKLLMEFGTDKKFLQEYLFEELMAIYNMANNLFCGLRETTCFYMSSGLKPTPRLIDKIDKYILDGHGDWTRILMEFADSTESDPSIILGTQKKTYYARKFRDLMVRFKKKYVHYKPGLFGFGGVKPDWDEAISIIQEWVKEFCYEQIPSTKDNPEAEAITRINPKNRRKTIEYVIYKKIEIEVDKDLLFSSFNDMSAWVRSFFSKDYMIRLHEFLTNYQNNYLKTGDVKILDDDVQTAGMIAQMKKQTKGMLGYLNNCFNVITNTIQPLMENNINSEKMSAYLNKKYGYQNSGLESFNLFSILMEDSKTKFEGMGWIFKK